VDAGKPDAHIWRLYKGLPHRAASILTQLQTGHVVLNGFLARIKIEPSSRCLVCHVPETAPHFLLHC
ncbi:hypothetical protein EXIGLDRAFT_564938, partial [Exidia glandulosa HHB12029]